MNKTNTIEVKVDLDDQNIPEQIQWKASAMQEEWTEAKAFVLALFDEKNKDTLRIDLWTKQMQMIEMDRFIYHILNSLSDTYVKSTNNTKLAGQIQEFARFFGQETQILKKS